MPINGLKSMVFNQSLVVKPATWKRYPYAVLCLGLLVVASCTRGTENKASLPPAQPTTQSVGSPVVAGGPPSVAGGALAAQPATDPVPSVGQPSPGGAPADAPKEPAASSAVEAEGEFRLVGEIVAQRKSQLAFKVAGFIENVVAKPGESIKQGSPLAALEVRDFKLRFDLAKIKKDQARNSWESANRELKRELALKEENASTEANLDRIKSTFDQSQLAMQLADIELKTAENALKDTKLVAPYDCVVATQLKYEGENVQSGTAVFEVYDITNPEITLRAPEKLLGEVKVGESISIKVPSAAYVGSAKVIRVVPVVNEKTRTFSLTAKFDKFEPKLVPGLYAEGTIKKLSRMKQ